MEEIFKLTQNLRDKASKYGKQVAVAIGIQPHEMPAGLFAIIFNKLTLALELLSHYYNAWIKATSTSCTSIEEAKQQNAERVLMLQRMIFTEILSSAEFYLKNYVAEHTQKIGKFTGRVYLRKIMERSKDHGVISQSDFTLWEGIIELRNAAVHNNAISERSQEYIFPKCKLVFEKDKMIQGDLKLFPHITDWLLNALKSWMLEMHRK